MTTKVLSPQRGSLIAVLVGSAIAVGALLWGVLGAQSLAGTVRTEGTVVFGGGSRGSGLVEFTAADGKKYSTRTTTRSTFHSYRSGERVPVAYDPANPADAQVADFHSIYLGPVLFGGFGLLIAALGVWSHVYLHRRKQLRDSLRQHGLELWISAEHTRVRVTHRDKSRQPIAFVIEAVWVDPAAGQTYTAKSDPLTEDPGPFLASHGSVRIRYDPDNPARNLIDIDSATSPREQ